MLKRIAAAIGRRLLRSGFLDEALAARSAAVRGANLHSGIKVDEKTAFRFSAVYASIRTIAETKASLPAHVYEATPDGKKTITRFHPVAELLSTEPHPDHTPMVFAETRQNHLLSWGNTYAAITWNRDAEPTRLTLRHPSEVEVTRGDDRRLKYTFGTGSDARTVDQSEMLHVPGFGNGITGWSPIRLAAESIGIGLANERFAATYFGNAARPGLIVKSDSELDDETFNQLQEQLNTQYSGANSHKALILEGGLEAAPITIPLNEAQFLESRKFQAEEIAARWYRLPPHVVGLLDRATFNNVEAMDRFFVTHTLRPWLIRDEQELNRKLFRQDERRRFYVKHNADAILRSDIKSRYEAYKTSILSGFQTIAEVRALEDLDPLEGTDQLILPESIFGQTDTDSGSPPPDSEASRLKPHTSPADPRLQQLTARTLAGLIHRELTLVQRSAGKQPDEFRQKVSEFYDRHLPHVRERLDGIATADQLDQLAAVLTEHRDRLLAAGPQAAETTAADWPDDADRLAAALLEPSPQ